MSLYFLTDEYFNEFPDNKLMGNKEGNHGRPCFMVLNDEESGIKWAIPVSSKVQKYHSIVDARKKCDTIVFGYVKGHENAFLIQNMCPVTDAYIGDTYMDKASNKPVKLSENLQKTLAKKASKVLSLHNRGVKLIFPDVDTIKAKLIANKS